MALLASFSLFPNLPPELRLKVYDHASIEYLRRHPVSIPYHPSHLSFSKATTLLPTTATEVFSSPQYIATLLAKPAFAPILLAAWEAHLALSSQHKPISIPHLQPTQEPALHRYPRLTLQVNPKTTTFYFPRPANKIGYDDHLRDLLFSNPYGPLYVSQGAALHDIRSIAIDYLSEHQGRRLWEIYNITSFASHLTELEEVLLVLDESIGEVTDGTVDSAVQERRADCESARVVFKDSESQSARAALRDYRESARREGFGEVMRRVGVRVVEKA